MTLVSCPQCATQVLAGDPECPYCGTATPIPPLTVVRHPNRWESVLVELRRVTAPDYRIMSFVGRGGGAGVYLAEDMRNERLVAIKVTSPSLLTDARAVAGLEQAVAAAAPLNHPNIASVHGFEEREGLHFVVMTHVPGRSLRQVFDEASVTLPIPVVRAWLYQMGNALGYAHRSGVVHGHVRPGNVLLDADGNIKMSDFGVAGLGGPPPASQSGGMFEYMSPEQCSSQEVSAASDQYSLGIVVYQMLTGQLPFRGGPTDVVRAQAKDQPPPIRGYRPDCPDDLVGAVNRMLEKQPEDRWPTVEVACSAAGAEPLDADDPVHVTMAEIAAHAAEVQVAGWPETLKEGARQAVEAWATDGNGKRLVRRHVAWESADDLIVSVTADGTLLGLSPGVTRVAISCGAAELVLPLEVLADTVKSVSIDPVQATISVGRTLALRALVQDWEGRVLPERAVLWSSQDRTVASVSPDGVVMALRPGSIVITAATGMRSAAVSVTVVD